MEDNCFDYVAEHEKATKRLNDLMAEYLAVKKAEREVKRVFHKLFNKSLIIPL